MTTEEAKAAKGLPLTAVIPKFAMLIAGTIALLAFYGWIDPAYVFVGFPIFILSFGFSWFPEYFGSNFGATRAYMTPAAQAGRNDFRGERQMIQLAHPEEEDRILAAIQRQVGRQGDMDKHAIHVADAERVFGTGLSDLLRSRAFLDHLTLINIKGPEREALRQEIELRLRAWRPDNSYEAEDAYMDSLLNVPWLSQWEQMDEFMRFEILKGIHRDHPELLADIISEQEWNFLLALEEIIDTMGPRRFLKKHWPNVSIDERRRAIHQILIKHGRDADFPRIASLLGLREDDAILQQTRYVTGVDPAARLADRLPPVIASDNPNIVDRPQFAFQQIPHLTRTITGVNQDTVEQMNEFRGAVGDLKELRKDTELYSTAKEKRVRKLYQKWVKKFKGDWREELWDQMFTHEEQVVTPFFRLSNPAFAWIFAFGLALYLFMRALYPMAPPEAVTPEKITPREARAPPALVVGVERPEVPLIERVAPPLPIDILLAQGAWKVQGAEDTGPGAVEMTTAQGAFSEVKISHRGRQIFTLKGNGYMRAALPGQVWGTSFVLAGYWSEGNYYHNPNSGRNFIVIDP